MMGTYKKQLENHFGWHYICTTLKIVYNKKGVTLIVTPLSNSLR